MNMSVHRGQPSDQHLCNVIKACTVIAQSDSTSITRRNFDISGWLTSSVSNQLSNQLALQCSRPPGSWITGARHTPRVGHGGAWSRFVCRHQSQFDLGKQWVLTPKKTLLPSKTAKSSQSLWHAKEASYKNKRHSYRTGTRSPGTYLASVRNKLASN